MSKPKAFEVNFDGLVGPTHNYAGLAFGNIASLTHAHNVSNPKLAALQGLKKMHLLMKLGIPQAVLPPHERPNIGMLRRLGFSGTEQEILRKAYHVIPSVFFACYSASSMWTANSATVSPSFDSLDNRVHFTVANLSSHFHRSQEAETTEKILRKIFSDERYFVIHSPLPSGIYFADEGAANHNRFCSEYGVSGLQLFVYGNSSLLKNISLPNKFPARQTLEAFGSIARLHQLSEERVIFAQQNPKAIDLGIFHNDVISVVNQNVFLYHEDAFLDTKKVIEELRKKFSEPLWLLEIKETELKIETAVTSYLFNSQLLTLPSGAMAIIAPKECSEIEEAARILNRLISEQNPISSLHFVECRESMKNGGGPACLRLRVVLTEEEMKACHSSILLTEDLYLELTAWVNQYYRDRLTEADLLDPKLLEESRIALDKLTQILKLGSFYSFQ